MKIFLRLFVLAVFAGIVYELFFGGLLFLNPLKIEYEHIKGDRADIYTKDTTQVGTFYYEVENDMDQAEEFTGLKYTNRPIIFVTQTSDEFAKFIPWVQNSKTLNGFSLLFADVIYINSQHVKKLGYDERDVLRHELIYNLMAQNSIVLNSMVIDNQKWFIEGIASYFGGPKYETDLQFLQEFPEKNPDFDGVSSHVFTRLSDDNEFNTTLYRLFIKYLIDNYGADTFKTFTKNYFDSPSNFQVIFFDDFKTKMIIVLDEFIKDYKKLSGSS